MTKTFRIALVLPLLVAGFGVSAMAEPGRDGGKKLERMMERLDSNGDGRLSSSEFAERGARMFERLDDDGDGAISRAEIDAMQEKRRAKRAERAAARFDEADANGDGRVTRAEFEDRSDARFAEIDANSDGYAAADELRAHRAEKRAAN